MTVTETTTTAIEASRPVELPPPDACQALRKSVHLTQASVGEVVGVTGQMVGFWESGRNQPTGERRVRYAELLRACVEAGRK